MINPSYVINSTTTLYAVYTATTQFTITFNANGGTLGDSTSTMTTVNGKLTSLPAKNPTYSGHAFYGWYTTQYTGGSKVDKNTPFTANTTVYARWSYTVSFNANGGTLASNTRALTSNADGKLSSLPGNPTRSGYIFQGWYTTNASTGGTQVTTSSTISADMTVYARWASASTNLSATLRTDLGVTFSDYNTTTSSTSILALFTNLMNSYGRTLSYVMFSSPTGGQYGTLYTSSNGLSQINPNTRYYYNYSSSYDSLGNLYFLPTGISGTWSITYNAYDTSNNKISGTLSLTVPGTSAGDVTLTTNNATPVVFNPEDFNTLLQTAYPRYNLSYVIFDTVSSANGFDNARGYIYYNYGASGQTYFTNSTIHSQKFYYNDYRQGGYPLSALTFVPGTSQDDYTIRLGFTAYATNNQTVTGTLVINVTSNSGVTGSDIVYSTTSGSVVPIRVSDLTRFFNEGYGSEELNYVVLRGVPATGTLYYNYDGTESYGTSKQLKLTSGNFSSYKFYLDPDSSKEYSLSSLTYVPNGSNYCVTIPFTAYGDKSSHNVKGSILISVTDSAVKEVYVVTTMNRTVSLDAEAIYSAVYGATGQKLSYIQFTDLPAANRGTLYYSASANGNQRKVTSSDTFKYSGTNSSMSTLTFTPKNTGSVNLPYVAFTSNGKAIAYGNAAIGVVTRVAAYNDMGASSWFYKYVVELSDAGVVNGMPDGSYAGNRQVTYGEALKLILLAAGTCREQPKQPGQHWAAGYLQVAQSRGYLAGDVDLDSPISRQAVANLAASAMRLSSYSSISPFADTNNAAVLKLYEAGIVEGSVGANGAMYFYPGNTLTRAEVAAIVWRINNAS